MARSSGGLDEDYMRFRQVDLFGRCLCYCEYIGMDNEKTRFRHLQLIDKLSGCIGWVGGPLGCY